MHHCCKFYNKKQRTELHFIASFTLTLLLVLLLSVNCETYYFSQVKTNSFPHQHCTPMASMCSEGIRLVSQRASLRSSAAWARPLAYSSSASFPSYTTARFHSHSRASFPSYTAARLHAHSRALLNARGVSVQTVRRRRVGDLFAVASQFGLFSTQSSPPSPSSSSLPPPPPPPPPPPSSSESSEGELPQRPAGEAPPASANSVPGQEVSNLVQPAKNGFLATFWPALVLASVFAYLIWQYDQLKHRKIGAAGE